MVAAESPTPPQSPRASGPAKVERWRLTSAALAASVLALAFMASLLWPEAPAHSGPGSTTTVGWWFTRLEKNAVQRLPKIRGTLSDVFFVDASHGWAVGGFGTILNTTDGGRHWQSQTSSSGANLLSVHFTDREHGWTVGEGGTILSTSDGGETWTARKSDVLDTLTSVSFRDSQHGWAAGGLGGLGGGLVLRTDNGGAEWKKLPEPTRAVVATDIVQFIDKDHGWIAGSGYVQITKDGGATWKTQEVSLIQGFSALDFISPNRGWAVSFGEIFITTDGGVTWLRQPSGSEHLVAVDFADAKHGWAVGDKGTIIATTDGGNTWRPQASGVEDALSAVHFIDARRGWAIVENGSILTTSNGGLHWELQAIGTRERGSAQAFFLDAKHGWKTRGGLVFYSSDGGRTWERRADTEQPIMGLQFINELTGWATGSFPEIMLTTDAGKTWGQRPQIGAEIGLFPPSFHFVDEQRGWSISNNKLYFTRNRGLDWSLYEGPLKTTDNQRQTLTALHFADAEHGWVVGRDGMIFAAKRAATASPPQQQQQQQQQQRQNQQQQPQKATPPQNVQQQPQQPDVKQSSPAAEPPPDPELIWERQNSGSSAHLWAVFFPDRQHGWAVGGNGTILATRDSGEIWTAQTSQIQSGLSSVFFIDSKRGWIAGSRGALLSTTDGGATWTARSVGTDQTLACLRFVNAQKGWVIDADGTLFTSADGGVSWQKTQRYTAWPPPFLMAVGLVALAGLILSATLPRRSPGAPAASIENLFLSDIPLDDPASAPPALAQLVRGIANYLGNPSTAAPVTLAITGAWGRGKSSAMNLLCHQLRRRDHRPVWFNAWHHQEADNVLAALLGTIREQAIPPPVSLPEHPPFIDFDGIGYRLRLIGLRARRLWLRVLLLHGLLAFSGTWLWIHWDDLWKLEPQKTGSDWLDILGALAAAGAGVVPAIKLIELLRAFIIDPAKLLLTSTGQARQGQLEAINVFRTRFAVEFSEVTRALSPRHRMVIFIDDLDRCEPGHLLQVLEATNFLNSSGECFIVLGMQRNTVIDALKIALPEGSRTEPERWLQKLIQVQIGVPRDGSALQEIIQQAGKSKPVGGTTKWLRWLVLAVCGAVTLSTLVFSGWLLAQSELFKLTPTQPAPAAPPAPPKYELAVELPSEVVEQFPGMKGKDWKLVGESQGTAARLRFEPVEIPPEPPTASAPEFVPPPLPATVDLLPLILTSPAQMAPASLPENRRLNQGLTAAAIVAGLVFLIIALNRRYRETPRDSNEYLKALGLWVRRLVAAETLDTPRELKRYVNSTRLDAMLVRAFAEPDSISAPVDPVSDRETHIVTLAAVERHFGKPLEDISNQDIEQLASSPELLAMVKAARAALQNDRSLQVFAQYKSLIRA